MGSSLVVQQATLLFSFLSLCTTIPPPALPSSCITTITTEGGNGGNASLYSRKGPEGSEPSFGLRISSVPVYYGKWYAWRKWYVACCPLTPFGVPRYLYTALPHTIFSTLLLRNPKGVQQAPKGIKGYWGSSKGFLLFYQFLLLCLWQRY